MATCATCPFWLCVNENDGECRVDAPRHITEGRGYRARAAWPVTVASEFCFEHPELKDQKYSVNICSIGGDEDAIRNRQGTV